MLPFLGEQFGDPGRLHAEGRATRVALEIAREQVAAFLGARPREVVFTSSGTEAINTALVAASDAHVVTTAVEHSSVHETLARNRAKVTVVGVDREGRVDADDVVRAVKPDTKLVSVQLVNHEVGATQPIGTICSALRERDVLVHVDACAAIGYLPIHFATLGADLCSVTAHKFGGPSGAGALLIRRGLRIPPLIVGGAQERARRAGIENVAAWVGFGAACAATDVTAEAPRIRALTNAAARVTDQIADVERYGDFSAPHILCLGVAGVEAEPILLALDQHGVAVHSGSSCSSETLEPSPVLAAMGVDGERSLRVAPGWSTAAADIERFVGVFPGIVERLRGLRAS
jgi:cysteine desulfurase